MICAFDPPTWASLCASLAALWIAILALRRGDNNSSASFVLAANESFRASWLRTKAAEPDDLNYELAELMNLVEVCCTVSEQNSVHGDLKALFDDYIGQTLQRIAEDDSMKALLTGYLQDESTFEHIVSFVKKNVELRKRLSKRGLYVVAS